MLAYIKLLIAGLVLCISHIHAARYVAKRDLKKMMEEQRKAIVEEVNDKMIYLVGAFSPSCPISTPLTKADLVDVITDQLIPEMKTQHSRMKEELLDRVLKMHQDTLTLLKTKLAEELEDLKDEIENVAKKVAPTTQLPTTTTTQSPTTTAPAQQDCKRVKDGVYQLSVDNQKIQVFCAGGFVTFQRRFNGQLKFDKTFSEYEQGFGAVSSEHWMGLKYLHLMTKDKSCTFRARLAIDDTQNSKNFCRTEYTADCDGQIKEIVARDFRISSAADKYQIHVVLNHTDLLHPQIKSNFKKFNGQNFSTKDQDNGHGSCARAGHKVDGGFWYFGCQPGWPNSVHASDKFFCSNAVCGVWCPYTFSSSLLQFTC